MRAFLGILLALVVVTLSGCVVAYEYAIDQDGTRHLEAVWVRTGTWELETGGRYVVYRRVWSRKH